MATANQARSNFRLLRIAGILSCALIFTGKIHAENFSFANSLSLAASAEKRGDLQTALAWYDQAEPLISSNAPDLCVLCRHYCDLTYLTNSATVQKTLLKNALTCALQAVKTDPKNALAHASLAVCYAKNCALYDIKTELAYSRLFKLEAEKTIALDPKQDIAYYLLGRWNYGMANVGLLSRAFVKVIYGGLPQASNEAAIENFKQAIVLAPNRILNHSGLAMVYAATGQKNLEIMELKKCRDLKPFGREDADAQIEAERKLTDLRQ